MVPNRATHHINVCIENVRKVSEYQVRKTSAGFSFLSYKLEFFILPVNR